MENGTISEDNKDSIQSYYSYIGNCHQKIVKFMAGTIHNDVGFWIFNIMVFEYRRWIYVWICMILYRASCCNDLSVGLN